MREHNHNIDIYNKKVNMKKLTIIIFFIWCTKVFATTITINGSDGRKIIKSVDNKIEKLFLVRESPTIKSIEGLDELPNLKYIQISFSDLSNMSIATWESMKKIETLKMDYCTLNNFEFLNSLPQLKVFSFTEGMSIASPFLIDLCNSEFLEYFEIHTNKLPRFPKIINCPKSLKYVIYNFDVSEVNDMHLDSDIHIFVKDKYQSIIKNNIIDEIKYLSLMEKYKI